MEDFRKQVGALSKALWAFLGLIVVLFAGLFYWANYTPPPTYEEIPMKETVTDFDQIENGVHVATGFVVDEGMEVTIQNCTGCHSAKLVTQNRMDLEGWKATIKWMQETQNLWDLGANETLILSYLSKNYAPKEQGRRQNLEDIDWYELK
ncbi:MULTISPECIES: monoheme cytochrome C [Flagellimonas]|uniref:Monoheme cytochrome C n=1 Tax=Flagellimonas hadalis TaxID=2597517 RepID=A0A5N5IXE1_9FLAO|nr:monoheme cytochrome C [Allomuricauda hadalis]KAB5491033.1 monoheme cytochrome C [Allomuricauda hadalis]RUA16113.1 MAG: monoheme cytochrome C [Flavobacteriia bacterium]